MTSKKIKIECEGVGHSTKISVDGKDLLKEIPGIYGIELSIFVDNVVELKLYQHAPPVLFEGKAKIIKIFGKENYCLVDPQYFEELKKEIERVKKGRKKAFEKTDSLLKENDRLKKVSDLAFLSVKLGKREISALKVKLEKKAGEQ